MIGKQNKLDEDAVKIFLRVARREIEKNNVYFVGYRNVYSNGRKLNAIRALLDIGIMSSKEIWEYIYNLKESECIDVTTDYDLKRDYNSEIFIFKKQINKKMVYIKLTINNKGLLCLSFHLNNGGNEYEKN